MKTLQEITELLSRHKSKLFSDYPTQSLAVFGSYLRKEQNKESDLDIMVEFSDKIGIRFIDLAEEIEQIIGFKVDLISKKGIKEDYLKQINSDLVYV